MPKFRIFYKLYGEAWGDIEAPTIEEAIEIARSLDGEHFHKSEDVDWVLDKDTTMNEQPEGLE